MTIGIVAVACGATENRNQVDGYLFGALVHVAVVL